MKQIHECSKCGAQYPKWQGRCSECGAWGTIPQDAVMVEKNKKETSVSPDKPVSFSKISSQEKERLKTNISEVDTVLGGGIVAGSLILLGGDPGIGKSTLALQIADAIGDTLYLSGEESANQIKLRAERINANLENLKFVPQTNIDKIIATIEDQKPKLAIIDSIQTVSSSDSSTGIGSAVQITTCTSKLMELSKKTDTPIIIIGHVTKEGFVAGPKALEHLVDTVLYLENDNHNFYKILRSVKNRFGSIGEIGVFEMTKTGLAEVKNPSNIFIESHKSPTPGSATTITMEGTRPFLVEMQALTSRTSFGYPIRKSTGFDLNRLQMIIAVVSKIGKVNLANHDIYFNITGGFKIKETATDLAAAMTIISAFKEKPINPGTLILGEVGLAGEIRSVPQAERRIKEAKKLNFTRIITAKNNNLRSTDNIEIIEIDNIFEAIKLI